MRDLLLLIHFTGLVVGAGSGFSLFVIGFISRNFPKESRSEVLLELYPLRYISYIGLALLVISGIQLLITYWLTLIQYPWLLVKLVTVTGIILTSFFGIYQMKRTNNKNINATLQCLGLTGKISFVLSMITIICATYTFH